MKTKSRRYLKLVIWIMALILIGTFIGSLTKNSVNTWYQAINRSPLTPPNYIFGIVWSILYAMIAISGWIIWEAKNYQGLNLIKLGYIVQLILNWSWTPLFFTYHLKGIALICLIMITCLVALIIIKSYKKLTIVSILLAPYLLWLLFASYLNFYIWQYN